MGEGLTFGAVGTVEAGRPDVPPIPDLEDEHTVAAHQVVHLVGSAAEQPVGVDAEERERPPAWRSASWSPLGERVMTTPTPSTCHTPYR
jgi:hypothetical protein